MAIAYFSSLEHAEIIEIHFSRSDGEEVAVRLLVDSGFTGQSSFVLSNRAGDFEHAPAENALVMGALQGSQNRCFVLGRIPALSMKFKAIAILADTESLALPAGVDGILGLSFLRQFTRWGAEKTLEGDWRFFLETD